MQHEPYSGREAHVYIIYGGRDIIKRIDYKAMTDKLRQTYTGRWVSSTLKRPEESLETAVSRALALRPRVL